MKSKYIAAIMATIYICCTYVGYGQKSAIYSGIDTENVLSYKVDEIIVMRFGGSSTHYNVSDLRLISKVDLGPGNIRIITPIYKDGRPSKKYYVESMTAAKGRSRSREVNLVYEITTDNNKIKIQNNAKVDPLEKAALLQILNKKVPMNKRPYIKPQIKDTNKNIAVNKNAGALTSKNNRLATQKANRAPEQVSLYKLVPKKELTTKSNSNVGEDNLKKSNIDIRTERDVKLKGFNERIVNAKLINNKAQENRRKKSDSIFLARKGASLKLQSEKENSSKPNAIRNISESKNNIRSRLLKEKKQRKTLLKVVDKKTAKKEARIKEPKLKSQKELKNRNREKAKSSKAGKIKVAKESSDLSTVRYDKTKYNTNTQYVKDSITINSLEDSLKGLEREKMELSAKSFKVNKLRNSKSTDTKLKQDSKVDIAASSRNNTLKNKQKIKAKIASLDSPRNKSKKTKDSKESDAKNEVVTKSRELVTEVSKIKSVTTDSIIPQNATNLNPITVFILSNMIPKSVSKNDLPPAKQASVVINVIEVYERVANKGYKSADLYQKIADSYFFKEDMETAVLWYEKLFYLTDQLDPVYYFRYGTALQKVGQSAKGDTMIERFYQLKK
ncbi:MAG: hypothetical protein K2Y30_12590 [Flavobacteriaceae bacterium]|nr:hypothetical protein [Flavobacteriaceae bacterium]